MAKVESTGWDTTYSPEWAVDYHDREHNLPGGGRLEASDFPNVGQYNIQINGAHAAGVTSLVVDPLPAVVPANTVLDFSGAGELVRVTARADKGATALTVEATDAAIEDNDTAPFGSVRKAVKNGTVIGRTLAERAADRGFGPAADGDDEIFILIFDVYDANINPECELYRRGGGVKTNFLPGYDALSAGVRAALASKYELTVGAVHGGIA